MVAGMILLSSPAAVRSMGSASVVSPSRVVSVVSSTAGTVVALTSAATTVVPLPAVPAPVPESEVQKRFNVRPILNWIWNSARWLWNWLVNAVAWGWNGFIGWWNGIPGWVRTGINWFIGSQLWDFYTDLRKYFFGW